MPVQKCIKNGESGYKWGENGVCFIGSNAEEKATAVGRAIHAQDSDFIHDSNVSVNWKIDDTTGFLTAPVILARTGIQTYYGFELGLKDRPLERINVYRSADEVFSKNAMDSYQNLVITDDHPNEAVTVDNVKKLQVGIVSNVIRDNNLTRGLATITDKNHIEKIRSGKVEVSLGYSQELKPLNKTVDGMFCEFQQTNIRGNHLATVDAGRCGGMCRILTDKNMENSLQTITIDGVEYETKNDKLIEAFQKLQKDAEETEMSFKEKEEKFMENEKSLEERVLELEKALAEAMTEKEKVEAEKSAVEKSSMEDSELNKLIADKATEKAKLISQAQIILGDKMPDCIDCDLEIMKAVIGDNFSEDEIMGKSPEYINTYVTALYDAAVKKFNDGRESLKELGRDIVNDKKNKITRDSARAKYIKTLGSGVN